MLIASVHQAEPTVVALVQRRKEYTRLARQDPVGPEPTGLAGQLLNQLLILVHLAALPGLTCNSR